MLGVAIVTGLLTAVGLVVLMMGWGDE